MVNARAEVIGVPTNIVISSAPLHRLGHCTQSSLER